MTSDRTVRIAGIEVSQASHAEALSLVRSSIRRFLEKERPDLFLLPEKWVLEKYEQPGDKLDELIREFCELSAKLGITIVPGSFSILRSEKLYNSSPVISDGEISGWTDKISLYRKESEAYVGGNSIPVFHIDDVAFSVAVCYDLDFPYYTKMAIRKGARIILNPSLIAREFHKMWHIYVRGRSLENRIPVVSVNAANVPFYGGSLGTWMQGTELGVLLMERRAQKHSLIVEVDYDATNSLIENRMNEDPGIYSLNEDHKV